MFFFREGRKEGGGSISSIPLGNYSRWLNYKLGLWRGDTELCRSDRLQELRPDASGTAKPCARIYILNLHHMSSLTELTTACVCVRESEV